VSQVELKAVITAKDRLSPKLSELQKKIKKFRKESAVISRGGIGMAAGLAGGATASLIAFAKQEDAATRLAQVEKTVTRTPETVLPALVLAANWYDNAARETDITHRNAVNHPGFMPVKPLRVPAR